MTGWPAFWSTYYQDGQAARLEALEFVRQLESLIGITVTMRILDFGCGAGFVAEALVPKVKALYLWDAFPNQLDRATENLRRYGNVAVLDLSAPSDPCPPLRFDLILVNSVVQYMTADELQGWLSTWAGLLEEHGRLVLSDLIPPGYGLASDLLALVTFHPIANLRRLGRDVLLYFRTRSSVPLLRVDPKRLQAQAASAGLQAHILPRNLTHFSRRYTAVLRPRTC